LSSRKSFFPFLFFFCCCLSDGIWSAESIISDCKSSSNFSGPTALELSWIKVQFNSIQVNKV
jgi:hypothetical protein